MTFQEESSSVDVLETYTSLKSSAQYNLKEDQHEHKPLWLS